MLVYDTLPSRNTQYLIGDTSKELEPVLIDLDFRRILGLSGGYCNAPISPVGPRKQEGLI